MKITFFKDGKQIHEEEDNECNAQIPQAGDHVVIASKGLAIKVKVGRVQWNYPMVGCPHVWVYLF